MQWIVIGTDGDDKDALKRRMKARPDHIAVSERERAAGHHLFAAAVVNSDDQMTGSMIFVQYDTREDLDAWLAEEPYVTGGVWTSIQLSPARVGPSFADLVPE